MARLPQPGGDSGSWGDILNEYLSQSHKSDGQLKDNSVTSNTIAPNSITSAAIATNAITSALLAPGSVGLLQILDTTITKIKLAAPLQASIDKADSALQYAPVTEVAGKTGIVTIAKSDVGLANVDNTSDATKNSANVTLTNKTISGVNNTFINIEQTSVVNLTSDLASKASAATVVRLTGDQTITGKKDFTGGITSNGATIVTAVDSRLSDARAPHIIDRGNWLSVNEYMVGDITTSVGRRWLCITRHTSGLLWDSSNWVLQGTVNEEYSLLPSGIAVPSEHLRLGGSYYTAQTLSQNLASGIRFGAGRNATIQSITIETTNTTTAPSLDVQFSLLSRSTNTVSSMVLLGNLPASTFNTAGVKTLTGLSQSVTAGSDFIISLCARSAGNISTRASLAIDPASYSIGATFGQTGWSGTNTVTSPSYSSTPIILVTTV